MDADERSLADDEDAWERVIEECQDIADEHREKGWSVVVPVPDDVRPVPGPETADDRVGLDAVVSQEAFDSLTDLLADAPLDEFESYRATADGVVYLTLVFRATETGSALCLPLSYSVIDAEQMLDRVRDGDVMTTYCHPPGGDAIEFRHEDPTPLLPPQ
ncbi:DUF7529 family protein [Halorubrum laminariae]|uniref:Uncharacterized protein n=1 Tax=Halorubrum laminariae TaxID=1433523 RepID=A0ABD6BY00_9EURY|nr:hypothetical protein [Halorubrum laminariae]